MEEKSSSSSLGHLSVTVVGRGPGRRKSRPIWCQFSVEEEFEK